MSIGQRFAFLEDFGTTGVFTFLFDGAVSCAVLLYVRNIR